MTLFLALGSVKTVKLLDSVFSVAREIEGWGRHMGRSTVLSDKRFLTSSGTHLDMLVQLFLWVCAVAGGYLFQLFEICESWLVACFLCGNSACGSLSSVLDFCGCDPHREHLCSLLISTGQCKLLVASFVTAGQHLWFSPYLEGFNCCYQGGFHLLIHCHNMWGIK